MGINQSSKSSNKTTPNRPNSKKTCPAIPLRNFTGDLAPYRTTGVVETTGAQVAKQTETLPKISSRLLTLFAIEELVDILPQRLSRLHIPSVYSSLYKSLKHPTKWAWLIEVNSGRQRFPWEQLISDKLPLCEAATT